MSVTGTLVITRADGRDGVRLQGNDGDWAGRVSLRDRSAIVGPPELDVAAFEFVADLVQPIRPLGHPYPLGSMDRDHLVQRTLETHRSGDRGTCFESACSTRTHRPPRTLDTRCPIPLATETTASASASAVPSGKRRVGGVNSNPGAVVADRGGWDLADLPSSGGGNCPSHWVLRCRATLAGASHRNTPRRTGPLLQFLVRIRFRPR